MANLPYRFTYRMNEIVADIQKLKILGLIYDAYLSGLSLGGVSEMLFAKQVPTSSGKDRWATTVLFDILADDRYVHLVGLERFIAARFETERRSRFTQDTGKRKTTRYHSKNVLNGLFICGEYDKSYQMVQRASGEMVWRCTNRVEYGNRICKSSPIITDQEAIRFVCDASGSQQPDYEMIREKIASITVESDGTLTPDFQHRGLKKW